MTAYEPHPTPAAGLRRADMDPDPFRQFSRWFQAALDARDRLHEPTAMTVATASADGTPSARIVLLKAYDERGFVFFTNYDSQKGRELAENPRAALVFYWPVLERQVRIVGQVSRLSAEESDAYFRTRPPGAQWGSWASPQSEVLPGRAALEARLAEVMARFPEAEGIPRPPHWGGLRVAPWSFEFWQGRVGRLHDRLRYRLEAGQWVLERLAP